MKHQQIQSQHYHNKVCKYFGTQVYIFCTFLTAMLGLTYRQRLRREASVHLPMLGENESQNHINVVNPFNKSLNPHEAELPCGFGVKRSRTMLPFGKSAEYEKVEKTTSRC